MSILNAQSRRRFLSVTAAAAGASWLQGMQRPDEFGIDALIDGVSMTKIPAGEFVMGSNFGNSDEQPQHRVRITRSFEMSKFEVTQAQWETVMLDPHAPSAQRFTPQGVAVSTAPSHFKGANLPVEGVSWDDIQVFLSRLNARDIAHIYRLPTEAEWEYACKAGKRGSGSGGLEKTAWDKSNSRDQTQPVGQKEPNAWGLHDMRGNVSEWVEDWYRADYYALSPAADPPGPEPGSYRVYRGGCWFDAEEYCRPALRRFDFPSSRFYNVGFRLVRNSR